MKAVGWIYIAVFTVSWLPGVSVYRHRHKTGDIAWDNPGPYLALAAAGSSIALVILAVLS